MTKINGRFIALLLIVATASAMLSGCALIFGHKSNGTVNYDEKMDASTGKWLLLDEEDTYFVFDGSEGVMTFSYYEDGALKYQGGFRSIYRSPDDAKTPLTFILTRSDKEREDWISCYAEGVDKGFTGLHLLWRHLPRRASAGGQQGPLCAGLPGLHRHPRDRHPRR